METRVAILSVIVDEADSVEALNELLHEYRGYIIGRMGLPHREQDMNIICVVLDAPQNVTSTLSGKIGQLHGVSAKTMYAKR